MRTCLTLTVDPDHGLRGGGEQGVGSDGKDNIEHPHGVSEMKATGSNSNSNIITNHNIKGIMRLALKRQNAF